MGAGEKQADESRWLVEQRYRAVLEVLDGSPVSEVADHHRPLWALT
jgi:hypothetical protein